MQRKLMRLFWGKRERRGFTLTEVLIASILLVVAIIPILKGLTRVHFDSITIGRRTNSVFLAQAKLNEIKAEALYSFDTDYSDSGSAVEGSYYCTVADDQDVDLKMVTVSVGYDEDGDSVLDGGEVAVSLSTYIARRW